MSTDIESVFSSKYNCVYRNLSTLGLGENYLNYNCSIKKIKIIIQLRLASLTKFILYFNNCKYEFDSNNICLICNMLKPDSLIHFLFECPTLNSFRTILPGSNHTESSFHDCYQKLLTITSINKIDQIFNFVSQAIRCRSFILNDW